MKKIYLLASALVLGASFTLNAQLPVNPQFENPGFEDWTNGAPDGWSANSIIFSAAGATLNPTTPITEGITNPSEGTSYIRLETFDLTNSPDPTQLPNETYGAMIMQEFSSTDKYSEITFDARYDIEANDGAIVFIEALDAADQRVGIMVEQFTGAEANWQNISGSMAYTGDPVIYFIGIASSEASLLTQTSAVATVGTWIEVDNFEMTLAGPDVPNITNLVAADIADNGNGTDLQVTFDVPADESNINAYYLLVFETPYGLDMLADIDGFVTMAGIELTPNGSNQSHTFAATDLYWTLNQAQTGFEPVEIVEDVEYKVYVYVKAKPTHSSVMSTSNAITLTSGSTSSLVELSKSVKVFPNPANDFVTIQVDGLENGNVSIASITGQEVINTPISGLNKVNVSALNNGVYIYKITNANGELVKTSKLVIQK